MAGAGREVPELAAPSAIGDAGASLVAYLEDALSGVVSPRSIVLGDPADDPTKEPVVVLQLADVTASTHLRNGQWTGDRTTPTVDPAALVLDLRYRITVHPAHGGDHDPTARTRERHAVLGHVAHALHEGATLEDPHLVGSLADGPPLHVTLDQRDRTPDHASIDIEAPALHYLVTPVVIDPATDPGRGMGSPAMDSIGRDTTHDRIADRLSHLAPTDRLPTIRLPKRFTKSRRDSRGREP